MAAAAAGALHGVVGAAAPPLLLLLLLLVAAAGDAQQQQQHPPSPGFYPSKRWRARPFSRDFRTLWGGEHQSVSGNGGNNVTMWLDTTSGSGFKSRRAFRSGYLGASVKLQAGYTAGVITALYLSNADAHPGFHDEVDVEFLGTTPGNPYTLQTNVYVLGSGDADAATGRGVVVGREVKFRLDWFDPTADFHHYAILWSPTHIIFYVDDVPIRRYARRSATAATFPRRPMWVYGSIWDASSWATDDGRYRADYRYSPFVARFSGLLLRACSPRAPPRCRAPSGGPGPGDALSPQQEAAMRWVQRNHMVYDYCLDPKRDHSLTPECIIHHAYAPGDAYLAHNTTS